MDRSPPPLADSDVATSPVRPSADSAFEPPTNLAPVTPVQPSSLPSLVSAPDIDPVEDFYPRHGDQFLHFRVVEELGRGGFARVYLAKQESLAHRLVAIKVTTVPTLEPQRLARLQHSNVVPIYSVHEAGRVQVVCMPYLGRTTLGNVIRSLATGDGPRPDTGRALATALAGHKPGAAAADPEPLKAENHAALAGMSFVNGCLSLLAQLAGGLAHAHARGILHRDLKPANVLVTDDGVPMILDFNVSVEAGPEGANKRVGGTVPYMAPEQLRAYAGGDDVVDERSDLYSLGVILHELLTGRLPFPSGPVSPATLPDVIARRNAPPPKVSALVPGVSRAAEAILARLLDPVPENRYARADDLREDLRRHLAHLPLAFALDTSVAERVAKWRRRNPRAATGLAVALAALFFLILPVSLLAARQSQVAARARDLQAAEASVAVNAAIDDLRTAAVMLGSRADPAVRAQGLKLGQDVVARYAMTDGAEWEKQPAFALLDPAKRAELKAAAAQVLILMTRAEAARGAFAPAAIEAAKRWNALAAGMFPDESRPAVVARHRDELAARLAGRPVPKLPPVNPDVVRDADLYFDGLDLAAEDRFPEAAGLLSRFCDTHPDHFLAWFVRGMCHDMLGQSNDAAAAFAACVALRPAFPEAHFSRGLARLKLRRFADADADFTRALALKPAMTLAWVNRGIARHELGKFADAEADFTAALRLPSVPTRAYFLRSRARWEQKDAAGAKADREEGLKLTPADAVSWCTRGEWRRKDEPAKAVEDFDAALALNPLDKNALLNKAIVLADQLNRDADALPVLTRLLDIDPDNVEARASRGVYAARIGRADLARKDAADSLKADPSAYRTYQVAGLFAQLVKYDTTGKAKAEALTHLAKALRAGFDDMALLKEDSDLDPIRAEPEFQRIVAAYEPLTPRKK